MKWVIQEKPYSCGPSAVRNCLLMYGHNVSERKIRNLAGTTKKGTTEKGIFRSLEQLGYGYQVHLYVDKGAFERNLTECLDADKPCIVLVDNCDHWVAVVSRYQRRIVMIDSEFRKAGTEYLLGDFSKYAYNYDKFNHKQYYYFIEVINYS